MDSTAKPMSPTSAGKKIKTNYLVPLVIVFLSIAAFLAVMYTGL